MSELNIKIVFSSEERHLVRYRERVESAYIDRGMRPGSHCEFGNGGGTGSLPDMSSSAGDVGVA